MFHEFGVDPQRDQSNRPGKHCASESRAVLAFLAFKLCVTKLSLLKKTFLLFPLILVFTTLLHTFPGVEGLACDSPNWWRDAGTLRMGNTGSTEVRRRFWIRSVSGTDQHCELEIRSVQIPEAADNIVTVATATQGREDLQTEDSIFRRLHQLPQVQVSLLLKLGMLLG